MQRWRGLENVPADWGRCVVTIGVYDGVHRGHQAIMGRAVERARDAGQPAVVVTFDPHPTEVVRPGTHPPVLTPLRYKAELLAGLGVHVLCVLPFTVEFSRLDPAEFAHAVLVSRLHASAVVLGANFRFGHRAAGDVPLLAELGRRFGFAAEGVPLLGTDATTISSTYIRSCVAAGDVASAAASLGRPHRVEGVVVRGDGRGRDLGFPTANLEPVPHSAIPADGVYAGRLHRAVASWPAAISVGSNPTFEGTERRVEAYAIDADLDLYGDHVGVDFVQRLRGMERFASVDELTAAMGRDVARTREIVS
ncbi:MAG TPA: bifunctional riboflavin kinase/FAD synthetase [Mycobacteriales bacterium]|nr:bifunctional riboflavin kinase/FAD synthetase [Mycobacteriales bacterium]